MVLICLLGAVAGMPWAGAVAASGGQDQGPAPDSVDRFITQQMDRHKTPG